MGKPWVWRGYVHLVGGQLATYEPKPWPALIIVQPRSKMYPEAGAVAAISLRMLRAQQRRAVAAHPAKGRARYAKSLAYTVVDVPDPQQFIEPGRPLGGLPHDEVKP